MNSKYVNNYQYEVYSLNNYAKDVTPMYNININKDSRPIDWKDRVDTNKRLAVSVPPELHGKMKAFCEENDFTVSEFIRWAVKREMATWGRP